MGFKRFLVAGGMASLVLIGVVLVVDAKSMAASRGDAVKTWVDKNTGFDPDDPPTAKQVRTWVDKNTGFDPDNPDPSNPDPSNPDPGNPDPGNPPSPQEEVASMGMGNMGDQQATSGDVQGAGGAGGDGGAGGVLATMTDLPDTGGPSVVLLLVSALLLGSGLWIAAFVRSGRS